MGGRRATVWMGWVSLGFMTAVFAGLYMTRPSPPVEMVYTPFHAAAERLAAQESVEAGLLAELDGGGYDAGSPLVVLDPYDISPLTALVLFTSAEPLRISVAVAGKTEDTGLAFTFAGYNTRHVIPVYGLYAGQSNAVTLTGETRDGVVLETVLSIETDPLPPELARHVIQTRAFTPGSYQAGFNFSVYEQKSAFDVNGDYRWYLRESYLEFHPTVYFNPDNTMILSCGAAYHGDVIFFHMDMLGRISALYSAPYGAHHDITRIDGGNLLVTGCDGDTVEDFLYELDVQTGAVVHTLDMKRVLQRNRVTHNYDAEDWFHMNSAVYRGGSVVVSGKHQSAVVKLSWPEGRIDWILSDPAGWLPQYRPYLLTPAGADFEWPYAQHAAVILPGEPDAPPGVLDVLMFDNGNNRRLYNAAPAEAVDTDDAARAAAPEDYSRMVQYRIDEKTGRIEQVWQYGKELGAAYFSDWGGSALPLENGNRLGLFEIYNTHSLYLEVTRQGEIVWEAYASSSHAVSLHNAYRAFRIPLYGPAAALPALGAPVNNLIPPDKWPAQG